MLVLGLDTSTAAVTAAVVELDDAGPPVVRAVRQTVDAKHHGELLTPSIAAVLAEAFLIPAELDAVVVGRGPGPFTGLRVGMVTAAALGDALGIPVYGVCSLDAIAGGGQGRPLLVASDARRREVYWAAYDSYGRCTEGPHVDRPADVIAKAGAVEVMAGAGATLYADVFGLVSAGPEHPDVTELVARAADRIRAKAPSEPPEPLYLRRPDAEVAVSAKTTLQR